MGRSNYIIFVCEREHKRRVALAFLVFAVRRFHDDAGLEQLYFEQKVRKGPTKVALKAAHSCALKWIESNYYKRKMNSDMKITILTDSEKVCFLPEEAQLRFKIHVRFMQISNSTLEFRNFIERFSKFVHKN